ncbi:MAG TPA: alpha/beta hydrolase [Candidatus Dormibacteraeota bacterium]
MDPQVRAYLDAAAAAGIPPVEQLTPQEARQNVITAAPLLAGSGPELPRIEDGRVPGPAGNISVRLYSPQPHGSEPLPVTVYFHGGGWVVGNLDTHDALARHLAQASGTIVFAADYRLAPEHPFPAALEDAWTVTRWVHEHAAEIGADPDRIAVAGDSAGGNLAAVVALRARDEGLPLRLQVLIYPVTDCDLDTESYHVNAEGYGLTRAAMEWYWNHYCPEPQLRLNPEASPLRAANLAGVAPALVVLCELDPLRDEGEAYARRLQAAEVPVELARYPGMIHGFVRMFAVIDRTHDLTRQIGGALRRAMAAKGVAEEAREA